MYRVVQMIQVVRDESLEHVYSTISGLGDTELERVLAMGENDFKPTDKSPSTPKNR